MVGKILFMDFLICFVLWFCFLYKVVIFGYLVIMFGMMLFFIKLINLVVLLWIFFCFVFIWIFCFFFK